MKITNTHKRQPRQFPGIGLVNPGQTVEVDAEAWDKIKGRTSIKALVKAGIITVGGRASSGEGGDGNGQGGAKVWAHAWPENPATKAQYLEALEGMGYQTDDKWNAAQAKEAYEASRDEWIKQQETE